MDVLLVEDDDGLRRTLGRILEARGDRVTEAKTQAEALAALGHRFELLILDVRLPDGNALEIVRAASRHKPLPVMLAMSGEASAEEAFQLAQMGVRCYIPKPLSLSDFRQVLDSAGRQLAPLDVHVAAAVGKTPIGEVQASVRRAMVEQALAMTAWNVTGAARLLRVTRQAVQQMIKDLELEPPS
jgi:DNA-binding NtrC family response regulator